MSRTVPLLPHGQWPVQLSPCTSLLLLCYRTLPADDTRHKNVLLLSRLHYEKSSRLMLQLERPLEFLRVQMERVALSEFQAQSMWTTSLVTCITCSVTYFASWKCKIRQRCIATYVPPSYSIGRHVFLSRNLSVLSGETLILLALVIINLLAPELFFLILAHSVYKMGIIQEPNMLEMWNKLHFEEEKMESIYRV